MRCFVHVEAICIRKDVLTYVSGSRWTDEFVTSISTVIVPVTFIVTWYTTAIIAVKLVTSARTPDLITMIQAVLVSVADIIGVDAVVLSGALPLFAGASTLVAVLFV